MGMGRGAMGLIIPLFLSFLGGSLSKKERKEMEHSTLVVN